MKDIDRPLLPKSLEIKRNREIILRVIFCCLLLIACIVIIMVWGEIIFPISSKKYIGFQVLFYLLFLLLPFVITGVPKKLIDTEWNGVITDVEIKESVGTYSRSLGKPGMYYKHDLILTIAKDDGEQIEYTAVSLGQADKPWEHPPVVGKIEYQAENFHVGEHVHKYYGFKYLYSSSTNSDDVKRCIVCGTINKSQDEKCGCCNSELIR